MRTSARTTFSRVMASTSPGYGITIRVEGSPELQPVALITTTITSAGATITSQKPKVVPSLLSLSRRYLEHGRYEPTTITILPTMLYNPEGGQSEDGGPI